MTWTLLPVSIGIERHCGKQSTGNPDGLVAIDMPYNRAHTPSKSENMGHGMLTATE